MSASDKAEALRGDEAGKFCGDLSWTHGGSSYRLYYGQKLRNCQPLMYLLIATDGFSISSGMFANIGLGLNLLTISSSSHLGLCLGC
jgi:hypothetical protein